MAKEKKTDILVARLLTEAGIDFTPEESSIAEINEALKTSRMCHRKRHRKLST